METYVSCLGLSLLFATLCQATISTTPASAQDIRSEVLPTRSSFGIDMETRHSVSQESASRSPLPLLQMLHAKLERLDVKLDSLESRLSFVENRLEKDLDGLEQRLTAVVKSSSALIMTAVKDSAEDGTEDVKVAVTTSEQRVTDLVEVVKESLRDDRSSTEDEVRTIQIQMSEVEQRYMNQLTSVVDQIEDKIKIHVRPSQLGLDSSSNFGAQIENIIASSDARFDNLTNYLESMIDTQVADLVTRITDITEAHVKNNTSSFDAQFTNFESAIDDKLSNFDARISNNSAHLAIVLKPQTCEKGLSPIHLDMSTPYPIINPDARGIITVPHLCDFKTNGGAWVVIQRRTRGDVEFYRNWLEYKTGFGSLDGDFWLGLDAIHNLTSSATYELRIDLEFNGRSAYARYSNFTVESESEKYRVHIEGYSGTAGDSLDWHNGMTFVTYDKNERFDQNCAEKFKAAWWYRDVSWCYSSNLNGQWRSNKGEWFATSWNAFSDGQPLSFIEMKVRPLSD